MNLPDHYPEILADLAGLLHSRLRDHLPAADSEALVLEMVEDVRLKFGGGLIYIPKGSDYDRRQRDAAIWRDFNGRNHVQLARKYRLGVAAVYDILTRELARRQRDLFN